MLRRSSALVLALLFTVPAVAYAWDTDTFSADDEGALVTLVNAQREAHAMPPLRVEPTLADVARWRAEDMATRGYFSHTTPEGTRVFDALHDAGFCYVRASESIAQNDFPDEVATQVAFDGWMNSSGDRAKVLDRDVSAVGVGAYKASDGEHVWTALFAEPCADPTPSPTGTPIATPTPKPPRATERPPRAEATPSPTKTVVPTATLAQTPSPSPEPTSAAPSASPSPFASSTPIASVLVTLTYVTSPAEPAPTPPTPFLWALLAVGWIAFLAERMRRR